MEVAFDAITAGRVSNSTVSFLVMIGWRGTFPRSERLNCYSWIWVTRGLEGESEVVYDYTGEKL